MWKNTLLRTTKFLFLPHRGARTFPITYMHYLMNMPKPNWDCLTNGLRIATLNNETDTVSINLYIDAGSRYEHPLEHGISHLVEHLIVKDLFNSLSELGLRLKCHGDREMVSISTECCCQDVPNVLHALLCNVFMNQISESEINEQKKIILVELCQREYDYYNLTFDYLHSTAFQGTPLCRPIMGTSERICNFSKKAVDTFYNRVWSLRRAVLVVVGGINSSGVVKAAEDATGCVQSHYFDEQLLYRYTGSDVRYRNDEIPAVTAAIALEGPPFHHEDKLYMDLAMTCVGSWHKSQGYAEYHPNICSRAAYYFVDGYKAFNISYQDTSLWGVSLVAEYLKSDDMVWNLVHKFVTLCTSITTEEIERVKIEMKNALLFKTQTNAGMAKLIGKSFLYKGTIPVLYDLINEIDAVETKNIRDTCMKYIYNKSPVVASVGPVEEFTDYSRVAAGLYWLRL